MRRARRLSAVLGLIVVAALVAGTTPSGTAGADDGPGKHCSGSCQLGRAARAFVHEPGGPPGIVIVVQRGSSVTTVTAGVADTVEGRPPAATDEMRIASEAKAYSGAVALALVSHHRLSLDDTIGRWLPNLPRPWWGVTLLQLLDHTSRIPDFSAQPSFGNAVMADPQHAPPPIDLLTSVWSLGLLTLRPPAYHYSNSDNVIVGLMVEAATHSSYESQLQRWVFGPLGLTHTSLPSDSVIPSPFIHGYDIGPGQPPDDVSTLFAAGWAWASGGIVSTPYEVNAFIRHDVAGTLVSHEAHRAQFHFIPGATSEPPGPGRNAAGLALFRYSMTCGTMYGHTGNTSGYTQFAAASADGTRSVTVSINGQITPTNNAESFPALRSIEQQAACLALGR